MTRLCPCQLVSLFSLFSNNAAVLTTTDDLLRSGGGQATVILDVAGHLRAARSSRCGSTPQTSAPAINSRNSVPVWKETLRIGM